MTNQQLTMRCATRWVHYSKCEQSGVVKFQCSRCRIHPNKISEVSFSSQVLKNVNQPKFMGECMLCMEMCVSKKMVVPPSKENVLA
jgi:hypothetical protein